MAWGLGLFAQGREAGGGVYREEGRGTVWLRSYVDVCYVCVDVCLMFVLCVYGHVCDVCPDVCACVCVHALA